jgi:hypothetical protein
MVAAAEENVNVIAHSQDEKHITEPDCFGPIIKPA